MPQDFLDETKATARLPNLDIEIVLSRSPGGDAERVTISLQAAPSFAAFGRFLEATNPYLFWMRFAQTAWTPWLAPPRQALHPGISVACQLRRSSLGRIQLRIAKARAKQVPGV